MAVTYDELYQRFKEEQERLNKELEQLMVNAPSIGEMREGSPFGKKEEGASETFEFEKRVALEKRLKQLLQGIGHALYKFEQGTYGLCDICGQPIDIARLEVLPQANLCLKCKAKSGKDAKGKYFPL
jgi:RNA polymerase-binding protein DksA